MDMGTRNDIQLILREAIREWYRHREQESLYATRLAIYLAAKTDTLSPNIEAVCAAARDLRKP